MWTLPNILTIARVIAAPLVLVALVAVDGAAGRVLAFALFSLAAITDFLDGYLARRLNQVSGFGRMLDPIADKAMVAVAGAGLLGLYGLDWRIASPIALILLREVMVSGLREYLKGAAVLSVTQLAKWKTTAQMVAIGALLLGEAGFDWLPGVGIALLWIAAALTLQTGWDYFAKGVAYIRAEEEEA